LVGALPALGQDYEDIFLANGLVARLRDPGKFATLRERATKVEQLLIEVLSTQDTMHPKVEVKQESGVWTVYSGPIRVLSVLPKDAAGAGLSQKALAMTWANNLRERLPLATPPSRMGAAAPRREGDWAAEQYAQAAAAAAHRMKDEINAALQA